MREIKFRAWVNAGGEQAKDKMVKVNDLCWGSHFCKGFTIGYKISRGATTWDSNPKALMQYTGLHDKNNREIYEGDILGHKFFLKPVLVTFENGCFIAEDVDIKDKGNVIIGNIYENPELLK